MRHRLALALLVLSLPVAVYAQDGGVTSTDGGGTGVLESIYVPNLPNAPFSLTLHTEWVQFMRNGGTMTTVNNRPIRRDREGRIYMERWILVPKGSDIPSVRTTIQIDDPVSGKFYNCFPRVKICEISVSVRGLRHYNPDGLKSGELPNGKGTFAHEDLGADSVAGLPVHAYRDTLTISPGVLGNDIAMATVREFRYSPELGFNLSSTLETPQVGRQIFTVTDLTTTDPDPGDFQPPAGYRLIDQRRPAPPAGK